MSMEISTTLSEHPVDDARLAEILAEPGFGNHFSDHMLTVEWTPEAYVFRVDGREYYRETEAVSQAQQYLVLSNLTSDYELAELTADEMSDTAQVDWVRVFDASSTTASRATHGRRVARRVTSPQSQR